MTESHPSSAGSIGPSERSEETAPPETPLNDPGLYLNRELTRLAFYFRVLEQAKDPEVPLLERVRFLAISSSILDEFFEVRVAGLKEQLAVGIATPGPDGLGPQETLRRIREMVIELVAGQYQILNEALLPALREEGVVLYRMDDEFDDEQREWLRAYFVEHLQPVLTPIGLDPGHPFPRLLNKSLNFIVSLEGKDAYGRRSGMAVVQAPRVLPRLIQLPEDVFAAQNGFVLLSTLIRTFVGELFTGMRVNDCQQFRVTRNSDLWVEEEEVEDLLHALKGQLPQRHYGNAVRLEVSAQCPDDTIDFLTDQFDLTDDDVYRVQGPVNLNRVDSIHEMTDRPDLRYPQLYPGLPPKLERTSDLFKQIAQKDILLHHPYQSFSPVLDLLRQAAADPNVLGIWQTLYRVGNDSPIGEALFDAAQAGKQVTAVVEVRARFDEAANIALASRLQEAGAQVVYGIVGYKTHSKMLMILRREGSGLRRYVHLGTGNYNDKTARAYTDFGLLTANDEVGEDVHRLFKQLTGLGKAEKLSRLLQAPFDLHDRVIDAISREIEHACSGRPARIMAKMNSLLEPRIIQALYAASKAGVKVDLVVRGICCLRPGVPGVSENIRVRSVVGRFLEHHRIFYFENDGEETLLLSSADWMPRNFFRRVEVAFPVAGKKNQRRVILEGLQIYFEDNCEAWDMQPDGSYVRARPGDDEERRSAQQMLLDELSG